MALIAPAKADEIADTVTRASLHDFPRLADKYGGNYCLSNIGARV